MNSKLLRSKTKNLTDKEKSLLIVPGLSPPRRRSKSSDTRKIKAEVESEENLSRHASFSDIQSARELKVEVIDILSSPSDSEYADTIDDNMVLPEGDDANNPNNASKIRIPDALQMIPIFSGSKDYATLYEFIAGCKDAKSVLPQNMESMLTKLIKTKLKGGALQVVRGNSYDTVDELITALKNIYSPGKSSTELCADLSRLVQGEREDVASYFNRASLIQNQLLEQLKEDLGQAEIPAGRITEIEKACAKYFILGLKKDIFPLITEKDSLQEAGPQAIETENMLKNRELLCTSIKKSCLLCNKIDHDLSDCPTLTTKQDNCQLCKFPGHHADKCTSFYICQLCGDKTHLASVCPLANTNTNKDICQLCKLTGHQAKDCVMSPLRVAQVSKSVCSICNKPGHTAQECRSRIRCYNCNKNGHFAKDCRNKRQPSQQYRPRNDNNYGNYNNANNNRNNNNMNTNRNQERQNQLYCTFCNRNGHSNDKCYVKVAFDKFQEFNNANAGNAYGPPRREAQGAI